MNMHDEIINSINDIGITTLDSEVNVVTTITDVYAKSIRMLEYCSNAADTKSFSIFQEGFRDFMEKKPDENIFKTIFLFIPRLILGVIDKIIAKFKAIKAARLGQYAEDLQEDVDNAPPEGKSEIRKLAEIDPLFDMDIDDEDNITLYINSHFVKDFADQLVQYYTKMETVFKQYETIVDNLDSQSFITAFEWHAAVIQDNPLTLIMTNDLVRHSIADLQNISEKINNPRNNCLKYMQYVSNKAMGRYKQLLNKDENTDFTNKETIIIDQINNFIRDMQQEIIQFEKVNDAVANEFDVIERCFKKLNDIIKKNAEDMQKINDKKDKDDGDK